MIERIELGSSSAESQTEHDMSGEQFAASGPPVLAADGSCPVAKTRMEDDVPQIQVPPRADPPEAAKPDPLEAAAVVPDPRGC